MKEIKLQFVSKRFLPGIHNTWKYRCGHLNVFVEHPVTEDEFVSIEASDENKTVTVSSVNGREPCLTSNYASVDIHDMENYLDIVTEAVLLSKLVKSDMSQFGISKDEIK